MTDLSQASLSVIARRSTRMTLDLTEEKMKLSKLAKAGRSNTLSGETEVGP